jgi:hypothetical protein
MTFSEFIAIADLLDTLWQRPGPFGEREEQAFFRVLQPFSFEAVEGRVLECGREPGRVFRPAASELIPVDEVQVSSTERLQREFKACCRIYGRAIAVEFFDPHGTADWLPPSAPGHDSDVWGKARKQLVGLGVLDKAKDKKTTRRQAEGGEAA